MNAAPILPPNPATPAALAVSSPLRDKIVRRVTLWVFFGFFLTFVPLLVVAIINAQTVSGIISSVSNEELLAVAFTLSAAAAADVLFSAETKNAAAWKRFCGSITIVLAFFSAMMYVVLKTHSYHIPYAQIVPGIQLLYGISMICALICEAFAEV